MSSNCFNIIDKWSDEAVSQSQGGDLAPQVLRNMLNVMRVMAKNGINKDDNKLLFAIRTLDQSITDALDLDTRKNRNRSLVYGVCEAFSSTIRDLLDQSPETFQTPSLPVVKRENLSRDGAIPDATSNSPSRIIDPPSTNASTIGFFPRETTYAAPAITTNLQPNFLIDFNSSNNILQREGAHFSQNALLFSAPKLVVPPPVIPISTNIIPAKAPDLAAAYTAAAFNSAAAADPCEYICDQCGKKCASQGGLGRHRHIHTHLYKCTLCYRRLKDKPDLDDHMLVAHKFRPYHSTAGSPQSKEAAAAAFLMQSQKDQSGSQPKRRKFNDHLASIPLQI